MSQNRVQSVDLAALVAQQLAAVMPQLAKTLVANIQAQIGPTADPKRRTISGPVARPQQPRPRVVMNNSVVATPKPVRKPRPALAFNATLPNVPQDVMQEVVTWSHAAAAEWERAKSTGTKANRDIVGSPNEGMNKLEVLATLKDMLPEAWNVAKVNRDWVWVKFDGKPSPETLAFIKWLGFEYSKNPLNAAWYHKCGVSNMKGKPRKVYGAFQQATDAK